MKQNKSQKSSPIGYVIGRTDKNLVLIGKNNYQLL